MTAIFYKKFVPLTDVLSKFNHMSIDDYILVQNVASFGYSEQSNNRSLYDEILQIDTGKSIFLYSPWYKQFSNYPDEKFVISTNLVNTSRALFFKPNVMLYDDWMSIESNSKFIKQFGIEKAFYVNSKLCSNVYFVRIEPYRSFNILYSTNDTHN